MFYRIKFLHREGNKFIPGFTVELIGFTVELIMVELATVELTKLLDTVELATVELATLLLAGKLAGVEELTEFAPCLANQTEIQKSGYTVSRETGVASEETHWPLVWSLPIPMCVICL